MARPRREDSLKQSLLNVSPSGREARTQDHLWSPTYPGVLGVPMWLSYCSGSMYVLYTSAPLLIVLGPLGS
ncbi:unnamed protein product [Mycena citricolor]|uniref:Uncharacterized protein n=1 Tax=Mycena citricolor TaxID=2018698 RepID=A0AAD2GX32_9AGAR|nr:unnamed protein product [Mycena citricolor]